MLTMPPLAMLTGLLQERAARQHRQLAALARRQSDDLAALGQLAAQLRESEKRYADSFEHAAIGIAEIALDGSWTRVNPALCAMLGYTQEQMLERTFLDVTHPDDRIEDMELVQSLCDSEVACSQWSKRYLHSSGTIVWASISVSLVRSATGAPLYYVSQIQDRTEQRAAEHKVRELNANLMALLESTSDLIWVVDAERFGMVLFNDGLRRQYAANGWTLRAGVTPEDVLPEPQAGYWRSLYANTLIHGGHEIEMRLPGGASIYSVSLNVVRRKGQVYGISVFARDVTEKRYAENAILAAKERAEASNRAKHEFLANISHELRTPLNGVLGMFALLEESPLQDEYREYATLGHQAGTRLLTLLNDVLDFSRLESGHVQVRRAAFKPGEVVASVAEGFTLPCRERGLSLELCLDPGLPERLLGDEQRVRQILFNLVGNAVKCTHKGAVRIAAWAQPDKARPGLVHAYFSVEDTGVGIADDKLDLMFQRFTQSDGSFTRQFEGVGLGLAIVRRSVELLEGTLTAWSEPDVGTCITAHVPFNLPADAHALAQVSPVCAPEPPLRLLLADDELIGQLGIRHMLEGMGHSVVCVGDGREVLPRLRQEHFDAVLMDIHMPGMDGVLATRMIRAAKDLGEAAKIPVIALTAYTLESDREQLLAAGLDDHVPKPAHQEDLRRALSRVRMQ